MPELEDKIKALPKELRQEVEDFVEFLLKKRITRSTRQKMNFDWYGGMSKFCDKYSSVELQHKAQEWRNE